MTQRFLTAMLSNGTSYPALLALLIPLLHWSRLTKKQTLLLFGGAALFLTCVESLGQAFGVPPVIDLIVFLCIFGLLLRNFRITLGKLLYLFFTVAALVSYSLIVRNFTTAMLLAKTGVSVTGPGLCLQYLLCFLILFCSWKLRDRMVWLLENFNPEKFWNVIWLLPLLIFILNNYIAPVKSENISIGLVFPKSICMLTLTFILFIMLQVFLYFHVEDTVKLARTESEQKLYEMAAWHQQRSQNCIVENRKMLHDFRHVMRTIQALLSEKQYDALEKYAEEYYGSLGDLDQPVTFCTNPAKNALLNYYYYAARKEGISCQWQISIPEDIAVSDTDFAILLGNLLENAIRGCRSLAKDSHRYIKVKLDTRISGCLYLTVVNSCSKDSSIYGEPFHSSWGGSGIGMPSISFTAKKYNGVAEFRLAETEFAANVMLRI